MNGMAAERSWRGTNSLKRALAWDIRAKYLIPARATNVKSI
jgi:hypothetical protein